MSVLLLLRHGQASFGTADYDLLTELGERQSVETGLHFARAGTGFDEVQIGPRRRHSATATAALSQMRDAPTPITLGGLDEFADASEVLQAAQQMRGLTLDEISALPRSEQLRHYDALIEAWMQGRAQIDGRPSAASFRAGVAGWLREVVSRSARSQHLLVVTSAGVIAAAVAEVLGLPVERMAQFTRVLRNASLTEIAFSDGRVSLMSFNSVTHLPPSLATGM
jgi:broad specificity phosphatase PhoE